MAKTLSILVLVLGGLGPGLHAAEQRAPARPNVLVITVDTLRADYVSTLDPRHGVTTHLDTIGQSGVVFTRAFAHAPLTLPSHTSIFTGLPPYRHGVHDNGGFRVADKLTTMAEWFHHRGYQTAAFVGAFPLDQRFGLNQGFDVYDEGYPSKNPFKTFFPERRAAAVANAALAWLQKAGPKPWFLWVHVFDPHQPYDPPAPYRDQYPNDPYAGEVAYADASLGRLLQFLRDRGLWDRTVIVWTADHGEALGDHGERTHGYFAYNATLHVPLMIHVPGMKTTHVVDRFVAHADIFPTVCALLGEDPPPGLTGRNLVPFWSHPERVPRAQPEIYFESLAPYLNRDWAPIVGIIWRGFKYIDTPIPELYDLRSDFAEQHNLAEQRSLRSFKLKLGRIFNLDLLQAPVTESPETLEMLKSLGYASGMSPTRRRTFSRDDDPKVLLPLHLKFMDALELYGHKNYAAAVRLLKEIITARRDMIIAYIYLAQVYREAGDLRNAQLALQAALRVDPTHPAVLSKLGILLVESGQYKRGIPILEVAARRKPDDADVWNSLGIAYWQTQRYAQAEQAFQKALDLDPADPMVFNNRGNLYFAMKEYEKARQAYRRALQLDPKLAAAYNGLGACALAQNRVEEALQWMKKALQADPNYTLALYNLGVELYKRGRRKDAVPYLRRYLELVGRRLPPDEFLKISRMIENANRPS